MKVLVVYYSLEGNTKRIAESIAEAIKADILELRPKNAIKSKGFMKYVWGGKQVIFKERPKLMPLDKNPNDYDVIFIGTPVWAGTFVPAFNTLFSNVSLENKKIALFCCYAGSKGKTFEDFEKNLQKNNIIGQIEFRDPLKQNTAECINKAKQWTEDLLNSND